MLSEAAYYSRMSLGVYRMLRAPRISDPEKTVLSQMVNREQHFLDLVRDAIFASPENPYNRMFQLAGCTCGDLEKQVLQNGLEGHV